MINSRMILGVGKTVAYVGGCLGIGALCGATAFPLFKETLGVKKVVKVKDIPEEEIAVDASIFEDDEE